MWIGSVRLSVSTSDVLNAGTDSKVQALVLRDGQEVVGLNVDYPLEDDLEQGAFWHYNYFHLPRRNDQTPQLPDGIGMNPMPYPNYGLEFSSGLPGHMRIRLKIHNDDMWIKDNVDLYIREVRRVATSFDTLAWVENAGWSYIGSWSRDVAMSTDSREGPAEWTLGL